MKPRIGISSCLLGHMCRYNGDHAKDRFITDTLGACFEYVPYCPEHEAFGSPREAIRLFDDGNALKVLTSNGAKDLTNLLEEKCEESARAIAYEGLSGFILKSKSPTCGLERVKVYSDLRTQGEKNGVGLFAKRIRECYPYLPIEEEGRLEDAWLRENFLMHVFAYADMERFSKEAVRFSEVVAFHTRYKYLFYAKSHKAYKELGAIVANHEKMPFEEVMQAYQEAFLKALMIKNSRANSYNVLLHMYGYFKNLITPAEKKEILETFEEFKRGVIPAIVAIKMLRLYIKKFEITYLDTQVYLDPYPAHLALRSEIKAYK